MSSVCACLNFKTSRVGVYKCLSLIIGFAVTVAIWPREVAISFYALSLLFGPCRLSEFTLAGPHKSNTNLVCRFYRRNTLNTTK